MTRLAFVVSLAGLAVACGGTVPATKARGVVMIRQDGPCPASIDNAVEKYIKFAKVGPTLEPLARETLYYCAGTTSSSDPVRAARLADGLLERWEDFPDAAKVAFETLDRVPPSRATSDSYVRVADVAFEQAFYDLASWSLKRATTDPSWLSADQRAEVTLRQGDIEALQGNYDSALEKWVELVRSDPHATSAVYRIVRSFEMRNKPELADSYCESLSKEGRTEQLQACLALAPKATAATQQAFLQHASQVDLLSDEEYTLLTTSGSSVALMGAPECRDGREPQIQWDALAFGVKLPWGKGNLQGPSKLYGKLAERGRSAALSRCFLASAAASCLIQIQSTQSCDDVRSLARFAEVASRERPRGWRSELDRFADAVFGTKTGIYTRYGANLADYPEPVLKTLLHLHLALYTVYALVPGAEYYQKKAFHLDKAQGLWKQLNGGRLPEALYREADLPTPE